jgi:hypothetical protein
MAKLTDDPKVAALVEKSVSAARAGAVRDAVRIVKALGAEREADAKTAGNNKDAARYLKSLTTDVAAAIKGILAQSAAEVAS